METVNFAGNSIYAQGSLKSRAMFQTKVGQHLETSTVKYEPFLPSKSERWTLHLPVQKERCNANCEAVNTPAASSTLWSMLKNSARSKTLAKKKTHN